MLLQADSDSEEVLIPVFTGCTGHFVDFVMLRLISVQRYRMIWTRSCENVSYAICEQQR